MMTARPFAAALRRQMQLGLAMWLGLGAVQAQQGRVTPIDASPTAPVSRQVPSPAPSAPIVIRRGGTYTGNWESLDAEVPAVTIETSEPVHLRDCQLAGRGHLVRSVTPGSDITVTHCRGQGKTPQRAGLPHGRFVAVFRPGRLVITANELVSTAGIYVDGGGHGATHISIERNRARNIEGRLSNGAGGLGHEAALMQFVQLNNLRQAADVTVAWNEVINEPGLSRVEDIISIHRSSGTPTHPIRVSNNLLWGAYPARPASDGYSGGGIIVDGSAAPPDNPSGYVAITGNQVLETTNYGIAVSAGVGVQVLDNRVLATGQLPDGSPLRAANVGLYVWDFYGERARGAPFRDHRVTRNHVAWWNHKGLRNDQWFPDCGPVACEGNESLPVPRERSVIAAEFQAWQRKLAAAGVVIGPR